MISKMTGAHVIGRRGRTAIAGLLLAVLVTVLAVALPARADDLSDERAEQVRQNCKLAQSVMQRLQATDVATRISRGRVYENLLTRIITPFNTRVGANGYDATGLNALTDEMSAKFTDFKNDYRTYEDSFSQLLKSDCASDPRGFYALLLTTRAGREQLASDTVDMDALVARYGGSFDDLRAQIESRQQ